jgi:gamma-glutamyl-gamma-aminobutyrate hydrolase PuuD
MIGMSSYREPATWGVWHQAADLLPANYVDQLRAAGAVPVLLPPGSAEALDDATQAMRHLDGIVLTGGADVDPRRYGAIALDTTDPPRTERDDWEIALVHAAIDANRPILAICRGLQILNVALGGTIIQHLPDAVGNHDHRGEVGTFSRHSVRMVGGSELARIYGPGADVPTHHHQAVGELAPTLRATAWADDGTIEAATCPGELWVEGVQWHPEVEGGRSLFVAFVSACDRARDERSHD